MYFWMDGSTIRCRDNSVPPTDCDTLSAKFSLLFIGHVTSIQVSFCYLAFCHCSFCINDYNLEEEKAFLLLNVYSFSAMLLKYTCL